MATATKKKAAFHETYLATKIMMVPPKKAPILIPA